VNPLSWCRTAALLAVLFLGSSAAYAATNPVSDAWITTKAKLALWTTAGIRSGVVNIDTRQGTVTMYGKVDSTSQKNRARQVVQKIDGVGAVRDLLQVVPLSDNAAVSVADDKLDKTISVALKRNPGLQGSSISVKSVDKGVVLLSGTAETLSAHLVAVEVADSVQGVHHVETEIRAPEKFLADELASLDEATQNAGTSIATSMTDTRITAETKIRFVRDSDIPALKISVDTNRGRVSLFGMVASEAEKKRAENSARQVSGVKAIDNQLQVVSKAKQEQVKKEDRYIEDSISKSLRGVNEFEDVDVLVTNGSVRLTGSVQSSWDRLHVALIARSTSGVRSVDDNLAIVKD
jgi:osmotically-inducible protein OsmY